MATRKPKQVYPPDWKTWKWPALNVLSFDQSLANTGWSYIRFSPHSVPIVMFYGTIKTEPIDGLTGFYDSFQRGEILINEYTRVISVAHSHAPIDLVAHEMPAMMGGMRSTKQEGPPISAMSVRASVRLNMHSDICHLPISMVEIHKVKKWTTGNGNALKPAVREGVWRVVSEFRTNEHVVDSIAIAIAAVAMSSVDKQTMQEVVFAT